MPPHLRPISFNFMHFLPENRMCAPPFATKQRPPFGKSWICHWILFTGGWGGLLQGECLLWGGSTPRGCLFLGGCACGAGEGVETPRDGYCCRWYASYWNAFLYHLFLQGRGGVWPSCPPLPVDPLLYNERDLG